MSPIDPLDVYKILRDERIEARRAEDHKELAALIRDNRRLGEIDLLVKLEDPAFRRALGQAVVRNAAAFIVGGLSTARGKRVRQKIQNGGFSIFSDVVATLFVVDQHEIVESSERVAVRDLRPAESHVHEHVYGGDGRPGLSASIVYQYRDVLGNRWERSGPSTPRLVESPISLQLELGNLVTSSPSMSIVEREATVTLPTTGRQRAFSRRRPARQLVVTAGNVAGLRIALGDTPITIGRAEDSTIVITDDFASLRHAWLMPRDGQWFVEDRGSTNGTYLDRGKVLTLTPVPLYVPIRIGRTSLELRP